MGKPTRFLLLQGLHSSAKTSKNSARATSWWPWGRCSPSPAPRPIFLPPSQGALGSTHFPFPLHVTCPFGFTSGGLGWSPSLSVGRAGLEKGKPKSVRVKSQNKVFHHAQFSHTTVLLQGLSPSTSGTQEIISCHGTGADQVLPHEPNPARAETSTPLCEDRDAGEDSGRVLCRHMALISPLGPSSDWGRSWQCSQCGAPQLGSPRWKAACPLSARAAVFKRFIRDSLERNSKTHVLPCSLLS